MIKHVQPLQRELNILRSGVIDMVVEVTKNLSFATGRSFYPRYEIRANYPSGKKTTIWQCIQMVSSLPWWRRLLILLTRRSCKIGAVKYFFVGRTNICNNAWQWSNGGEESLLETI